MSELDNLLLSMLIIAFGVVAILNGQRLYWVFVGIGGAVLGLILTGWLIPASPEWMHILVMVIFGLLSAFFARFDEKISVRAAAFILGGYILHFLLADAGLVVFGTTADFFVIVAGGILGVTLELIYGASAMIVISCFCGAALVTVPLQASNAFQAALFSGLAAVGMLLQSREWIDQGVNPSESAETDVLEIAAGQ